MQKGNQNIDITLSVLCAVAKEDETLTNADIAELCGCNTSYIQRLYASAIKKISKNNGLLGYEG